MASISVESRPLHPGLPTWFWPSVEPEAAPDESKRELATDKSFLPSSKSLTRCCDISTWANPGSKAGGQSCFGQHGIDVLSREHQFSHRERIPYSRTPSPLLSVSDRDSSVEPDDVHEEDCREGEGANAIRYDFRPSARIRIPAFGSTWHDYDQSGNYDPTNEGKALPTSSIKRKRTAQNVDGEGVPQERREPAARRPRTVLSARQRGETLVLSLHLTSSQGRNLLQQYPDNWPDDEWSTFRTSEHASAGLDQITRVDLASYLLRNRIGDNNESSGHQYNSRDVAHGSDDDIDLTGHPAARGCKACRNLHQGCPLLEPENTYPCYFCVEDGYDCEPVVEPRKKRGCEECKRKRIRCSYNDGNEYSLPCFACQESGYRCVAGPAIDPTRTRLTTDGKPATVYKVPTVQKRSHHSTDNRRSSRRKRYLTCVGCKEAKKRCSLRRNNTIVPCLHCKLAGSTCVVEDTAQDGEDSSVRLDNTGNGSTPGQNPEIILPKLSHPIVFNCEDPMLCEWCEDPSYGILGSQEVSQGQSGYQADVDRQSEPNGVHEQGNETSVGMCADCTMDRLYIVVCNVHEMRPIPNRSSDGLQWYSAFKDLINVNLDEQQRHEIARKFCSICPSLASYECWKGDGIHAGDSTGPGCGLSLCGGCRGLLVEQYRNSFERMLEDIDGSDRGKWLIGLRADYKLLGQDGLMMRELQRQKQAEG